MKLMNNARVTTAKNTIHTVVDTTVKAATYATEQTADATHRNRATIEGWITKAGTAIDDKTSHKYRSTIDKVTAAIRRGLDKLVAQRPDAKRANIADTDAGAGI